MTVPAAALGALLAAWLHTAVQLQWVLLGVGLCGGFLAALLLVAPSRSGSPQGLRLPVAASFLAAASVFGSGLAELPSREAAASLIDARTHRLIVRAVSDTRSGERVDVTHLSIDSVPGAPAATLLVSRGEWPGLRRGDSVEAWFVVKAPRSRERAAVTLQPRSAPIDGVKPDVAWPSVLRRAFTERLAGMGGDGPRLTPGMITGDRTSTPPDLDEAMLASGLSHLTAVSGSNVAVVLGLAAGLARRLGCPPGRRWMPLLVLLLAFLAVVGPDPPVLRAAVMGAIGALAVSLGRAATALRLLGCAVVLLLVVDPWQLLDLAFQLSVVATAGIVVLGKPLTTALGRARFPRAVAEAVAISVAATLACTPLLVLLRPDQPWWGVPVNAIVALPAALVAASTPFALPVVPWLGGWADGALRAYAAPAEFVAAAARFSSEHGPRLTFPDGWAGFAVAAAGCWPWFMVPALARSRRVREWLGSLAAERPRDAPSWRSPGQLGELRRRSWGVAGRAWVPLCCCALLATSLLVFASPQLQSRQVPVAGSLVFCNVGQGDATVLLGGEGTGILIDAGPDNGLAKRCLDRLEIRTLCAVIVTHRHADHDGGLVAAIRGRAPRTFWYSTRDRTPPSTEARIPAVGESLSCGPWSIGVLRSGPGTDENESSLAVAAHSSRGVGLRLLAAGDLEAEGSSRLVAETRKAGQALDAPAGALSILKVSHHGSRDAGSVLADAFDPDLALIGVGSGIDYGHPHSQVLDDLARRGVAVRRTDLDGTIVVEPQADAVDVRGHSEEHPPWLKRLPLPIGLNREHSNPQGERRCPRAVAPERPHARRAGPRSARRNPRP